MGARLLVRVYNVGFGECIYVRVPDRFIDPHSGQEEQYRHILIDCGSKDMQGLRDPLSAALRNVYDMLGKRRRLDLLLLTHDHADHYSGFDPRLDFLWDIDVDRIWLSPAMKPDNPQAEGYRALRDLEWNALNWLAVSRAGLPEDLRASLSVRAAAANARRMLTEDLPPHNDIKLMYVYRGMEEDSERNPAQFKDRAFGRDCPQDPSSYLLTFNDPTTRLVVCAPEWEVDEHYGSEESRELLRAFAPSVMRSLGSSGGEDEPRRDLFRYDVEAMARLTGEQTNNTSVVLLLQWRGYRLLFTGDAQERSWSIMWRKNREALSERLDFLKIGHHGSENGTPWNEEAGLGGAHPILDEMLEGGKTQVVISTCRSSLYEDIPSKALLSVLGRRAANADKYPEDAKLPDKRQPERTDLVFKRTGKMFIEKTFPRSKCLTWLGCLKRMLHWS